MMNGVASAQKMTATRIQAEADYGKLPLRFEPNHGQFDPKIKFFSRGTGYGVSFTRRDAVLSLHKTAAQGDVVHIQIAGQTVPDSPTGESQLPGVVNYMQGNDPAAWRTNIPTYAKVRYAAVYPGVDLLYYGSQQQLEYDFVVAPHTDASQISLRFAGARNLHLDRSGNLVITANNGSVAFHKPVVYQILRGQRHEVAGNFSLLAGNTVAFRVGPYDRSQPLTIDPTLIYSTYLGGTSSEAVKAMAVDSSGNAYVTGQTTSADFPVTAGALQANTVSTSFVSKLNPSGTALLYSTYLGPSATTTNIAVDSSGDAVVIGSTTSASFPVTSGVFQATNKSTSGGSNAFIAKLNPTGTGLVFSTYLGGSNSEVATGLALNSTGDIYLAGYSYSTNFPVTTGAYQTTNASAVNDEGWNNFITEMNPTGTALIFSTFLGGNDEYGEPPPILLALDSSGNTYVSSNAISVDFPTTAGAYQTATKAKAGDTNITLSKLNATGTKLLYSTWLDGPSSTYQSDLVNGIAVDTAGDLYVAGVTYESAFPTTAGALQTTNKNGATYPIGFVTKLNAAGSALVYSTYLGGSGGSFGDTIEDMAIDSAGNVYVTGGAGSPDFPVTSNAYQTTNLSSMGGTVPFLSELNPAGNALVYSTYFGSTYSYEDSAYALALASGSSVYFGGLAEPYFLNGGNLLNNFPITPGALEPQSAAQAGLTGFVAKLDLGAAPTTIATVATLTSNANPVVTGNPAVFTVSVAPTSGSAIPTGNVVFSLDEGSGTSVALNAAGKATYSPGVLAAGNHYILASYAGTSTYASSAQGITEVVIPANPVIIPAGNTYTSAQLVTFSDVTPNSVLYYTTNGSTPNSSSTKYTAPILVSTAVSFNVIAIVPGLPSSKVEHASYSFLNAPTVLAVPASAISTPNATLNGLVFPGGMAGSYHFLYGTSATALTGSTAATSFGGSVLGKLSFAPIQASAKLTMLQSKVKYYFQIVVTTASGTSSGTVLSFTTN
jgi:hypothetical protein